MSITVFKYPLALSQAYHRLKMPKGAIIRHVGTQTLGFITMWAEIDREADEETRIFTIVPTGGDVPENSVYVGSTIDQPFVWHLYEHC